MSLYRMMFLLGVGAWLFGMTLELAAADPKHPLRTWRWSDGKFQREGRYEGMANGFVKIDMGSGKEMRIPFSRLSEEDQQYVKRLIAGLDSSRPPIDGATKDAAETPKPLEIPTTDDERIRLIRQTNLWEKTSLDSKQLSTLLAQLRVRDAEQQKVALTRLALTRPDPSLAGHVIEAAKLTRSVVGDSFYRTAFASINTEWGCAQQAADVSRRVGRRGGLRALESMLVRGKGLEKGQAVQALKYSFDSTAAEILVRNMNHSGLGIQAALKDMGPVAAPAVADLLDSTDAKIRRIALDILEEIGTSEQLPAIRSLLTDRDGIVTIRATQAVKSIEASGR